MHAHKLMVNVTEDQRIAIRLPDDFPQGPAEVIVLASVSSTETLEQPRPAERGGSTTEERPGAVLEAFARRFPLDPLLSQIVLHEDPSLPIDAEDWPEDSSP